MHKFGVYPSQYKPLNMFKNFGMIVKIIITS